MKFGTTNTSSTLPESNWYNASLRLGSSFQNAQRTSANSSRRRISAAWDQVGALESELTVEPWPTIKRPVRDRIGRTSSVRTTSARPALYRLTDKGPANDH